MYFSTLVNYSVFFCSSYTEVDLELIPSDHPRASTIFLKKSQKDGKSDRMLVTVRFLFQQIKIISCLYMRVEFVTLALFYISLNQMIGSHIQNA